MIDFTKTNYSTAQTKGFDAGLRQYMLKIYNYMSVALVVTGVAGYFTMSYAPLTRMMFNFSESGQLIGQTGFGLLVMLSPIAIAFYFFSGAGRMSIEKSKMLLWVYAGLTGMALSSLGFIYTGESIARSFFITAATFASMSLYGYSTQRDLTSMGSFMVMGVMGLIIASLANMFFQSSAIYFATSLLGIGIFMGLIAWDTQKLKNMYFASGGGEMGQKMAVMGAFNLYLDFINLFLYMLRFFGNKRD